jgi:hypothetical protein
VGVSPEFLRLSRNAGETRTPQKQNSTSIQSRAAGLFSSGVFLCRSRSPLSRGVRGARFQLRLLDALHRPADEVRRGLLDGKVVQEIQNAFCGFQAILKLSFNRPGEHHFDKPWRPRAIGPFEQQVNRMPVFSLETFHQRTPCN